MVEAPEGWTPFIAKNAGRALVMGMDDDLFSFASGRQKPPSRKTRAPDSRPSSGQGGTNDIPAITVSEFTKRVRQVLEGQIGKVRVEGEISNYREQASGHRYFTLKDNSSQVSCVLFRGDASRLRVGMEDGQQVSVDAEISVYEPRGNYQLIVRRVQLRGEGALQAKFEALKRKLHAEGLFEASRKKAIPKFPRTICLITSPTGAAVRDMLNVLRRRAPWVRVLVYPVRVQGAEAAGEIVDALATVARESGKSLPEIDTVLLARGGGSLEDLWSFNEESVARAVAAFPLPIVSGVGHEIDFTITDFAADLRAPTPSAASELAVPDRTELSRQLDAAAASMSSRVHRRIEQLEQHLDLVSRRNLNREVMNRIEGVEECLRQAEGTMRERAHGRVRDAQLLCDNAARTLRAHHPRRRLEHLRERFEALAPLLRSTAQRRIESAERRIEQLGELLIAVSPESAFKRGYSVTFDKRGNVVRDATQLERGDAIQVLFAKSRLEGEVLDVEGTEGAKQKPAAGE